MVASLLMGIGTAVSVAGALAGQSAQQDMLDAQLRMEEQRRLQMELEARRRRLETVRNIQRAQATSLSTAVAQGAQGGSGLLGAYGQIFGQGMGQINAINQNEQIGENMFDLNAEYSAAAQNYSQAQSISAIGGGISSLGGAFGGMSKGLQGLGMGQTQAPSTGFGMNPWYSQLSPYNPGMSYDPRPYG